MSNTPARFDFHSLALEANDNARAELMSAGTAPSFDALLGWEFAGLNTLATTDLAGIRKFMKGFYQGPPLAPSGPEPFIQGYNVKVVQGDKRAPHVALEKQGAAVRHGFFRVYKVDPEGRDHLYPNALLLNYGLGANGLNPAGLLRDYLVQPYPDNADLLLGYAVFALGPLRIPGGYFVLQRLRQHTFAG